ncbi:unnamed protein product [Durusdinium trenchii]|uniref:Uncharacterized protein n=1 Tax=Durusdinium trenchii TaxID=1381693 RepID=A0ABP0SYK0_9DINO
MNATSSDHGGLKYFSGDSEDQKEYRRWKAWVQAKMLTLDKMPKEARGAYVFTLLSGKALECVEHLEPSKYQTADGEKVLFELLDARFPQKEMSDEMSETLTEIFNLKIHEGESLKAWISRASEMFDRCLRKTNVSFPEEAKGWLILHRSGLSNEQKAVCLARSLGVLKREEVGKAMRSCYPEYVGSKKSHSGAAVVETDFMEPDLQQTVDSAEEFHDVEQFLAEHELGEALDDSELKRVASTFEVDGGPAATECLLVSSPGFGVIDSGCGRTIIGKDTLASFQKLWKDRAVPLPVAEPEENHFRFGNGNKEVSSEVVPMPVNIAGRTGVIRAAVVQGRAPLLISRSALQKLKAVLDFDQCRMTLFDGACHVPLQINAAGQFVIDVIGSKSDRVPTSPKPPDFEEVMASVPDAVETSTVADDHAAPDAEPESLRSEPVESDECSASATALYRPAAMRQEDFLEVIKEVGVYQISPEDTILQQQAGFSLVPFSNEVGGAMTDASKRRDGSLMEHQQPKKPHAMPKAVFPLGAMGAAPMSSFSPEHVSGTPMMNSSDASAGYVASIQFAPPMPQSEKSSNLVPELPPQVESLEEWGRTVIQFGQYKGCNMSYAELASSEDSRAKSYIKWVTARHRSSTGLLHDLAGYLVRYQFEIDYRLDEAWSGTCIPGTSVPRAMK